MEALLALEDGRIFRGRSFGAPGERAGEVVFNTGMTGYQEVLTDPSYRGQIVVMTSAEIGNYGVNPDDWESARPHVAGFCCRAVSTLPSSWRATQGLPQYLHEHGIPGIAELDTRALTRHIRSRGAMRGVLSTLDRDPASLVRKACAAPRLEEQDLIAEVTCPSPYGWRDGRGPGWRTAAFRPRPAGALGRLVALDYGVKRNSLRLLAECGFDVLVAPASTSAADVLALAPRSVFLSNGPGDPASAGQAVETVRGLLGRLPVLGICLGHQLAARALGGRTFKLKFGHHGSNHPVRDLRDGRVAVTSQNHGYAVDPDSLPSGACVTHVNLNDETCEGFALLDQRLLTVQYHPEASPGPHDSHGVFAEFCELVAAERAAGSPSAEGRR
jgi:carbamoyl-phosphate synthase small subunit